MVELVVAPEESSQGCATADTQHSITQQSSSTATTSTTMLEPAARLPVLASTGFAATALRDLPTLTCSVQPNRSLPLRPAPPVPRRSAVGPPNHQQQQQQQQQHRRLFSSDEDEKPQDEDQAENKDSSSRLKKYLTQPITTNRGKEESSSSTRNGDGPRIIEDIVVDAAKMVPPLRLKKLAAAEQQEQSSSQVEEKKLSEDEQSNYCIVKEPSPTSNGLPRIEKKMGGEKVVGGGGEEPKSIEIVIPSIPELGIKETRTDMRVNVPQDPAAGRPFIVNYVLAKDGKYPTVLPLNVKLPGVVNQTSAKNPDPGGISNNNGSKSEPNLTPSPSSSIGDKLSVRSMPLLGLEDNDEVQIIPLTSRSHDGSPSKPSNNDISPAEKRRKWYVRREQLREKFRELRAQAIEMRTQIDASRSVLPEDSADRPKFQKIIDDCDARINDYSNKLRKLNEVVSAEKFHAYCDEVGEEKVYDDEPQEDKSRSSNELMGKMSPMNELQRRTPNGYYATTTTTTTTTIPRDVDRATATYVVRSKPPNGVTSTSQQQQQRRGYSSFSIDELSAAPRTNATRAPANSPREALVPGAWVESQPGTSAGGTDVEKRPLDLATKRPASQEEMVKEDRKKRRRVSDVSMTHWPAGFAQPQLVQQHPQQQQQHRGGHEVFTLPAQPSRLYPYVPEATIWSPNGIIVQHREQPANLGERLVRNLDYRALWHDKPVSSLVNERQPLPADYVLAVQRMHESAVTPEQAKARESTVVKTKPAMQQQQQQQQQPPPPQPQSSKAVSESVVTKTSNHDILEQTASSKNNTTLDQQQQHPQQQPQQQQQRIMAEQFPIFGMWADALKRQSNPDKKDVDTRQAYYQIPGTGVYKPIANANAMPTANYVTNGVPVRWPETTRAPTVHQVQSVVQPPQQQQQQSATAAGGQSDVQRHQAYYPAPMALAYPHKFPLELYQKASSLGYPYPYATPIAYSRMPLEATSTITSQSRVPPLIPLGGNPSAASAAQWDPEKRTLAVPAPQHHFYSQPPPPQPQAPGGEARYARRGSLVDYNGNPMLSAEQAARLREAYEQRHYQQSNAEQVARQQQQQQQARAAASGKPQAYAQTNVARNGTSSTTNTPHYNSSSQRAATSSTSYAKQSNGNYDRECPTPNLGEVNRSPSGIQSLRCSNCGAPSSRFECLGCETTFYCNEACQAQHWSVHGAQCPKIMPRLKKLA